VSMPAIMTFLWKDQKQNKIIPLCFFIKNQKIF
jgi:hypothetical protein